jgi:putative ABC transport system permease protein
VIGLIAVNLRRRRTRTLLTAVGIAVGVATIVALLSLTEGLKRGAAGLTGLGKSNIGLFQSGLSDLTNSALPQSMVPAVRTVAGITDASAVQIVTNALPADPSLLLFGLDPSGFVARRLVITAGRRPGGEEAMIGDTAARRLSLGPGQTLALTQQSVPIVGVYHSGVTFEDLGASVALPLAQRLSGRGGEVTTIAVSIAPTVSDSRVTVQLERRFPGTVAVSDPGQIGRASPDLLLIDKAVVVIAGLALIIGGISVTNTMVLSVSERQRELGLLAAVGWSPRQIAALIFGEGVGLSLIGAALGLGAGIALSRVAVDALSASAFVTPRVTAWGLGRGLLVGIAIGVLGGVYPAWRVTRLDPARALARA